MCSKISSTSFINECYWCNYSAKSRFLRVNSQSTKSDNDGVWIRSCYQSSSSHRSRWDFILLLFPSRVWNSQSLFRLVPGLSSTCFLNHLIRTLHLIYHEEHVVHNIGKCGSLIKKVENYLHCIVHGLLFQFGVSWWNSFVEDNWLGWNLLLYNTIIIRFPKAMSLTVLCVSKYVFWILHIFTCLGFRLVLLFLMSHSYKLFFIWLSQGIAGFGIGVATALCSSLHYISVSVVHWSWHI